MNAIFSHAALPSFRRRASMLIAVTTLKLRERSEADVACCYYAAIRYAADASFAAYLMPRFTLRRHRYFQARLLLPAMLLMSCRLQLIAASFKIAALPR